MAAAVAGAGVHRDRLVREGILVMFWRAIEVDFHGRQEVLVAGDGLFIPATGTASGRADSATLVLVEDKVRFHEP
jgi:hypothetical protein